MAQSKMACWNITARDFRRVRGFPVAILDGDTQNIEVLYHWYMIDIWMYIYIIILWCYYYVYGLIWVNMVETCWDHLFFPFNSIPNVGSTLEVFLAQQPWLWMGFLKISPQYLFFRQHGLSCWDWAVTFEPTIQWIGLREKLQETIDFPIKYGFSRKFSLNPIHWTIHSRKQNTKVYGTLKSKANILDLGWTHMYGTWLHHHGSPTSF